MKIYLTILSFFLIISCESNSKREITDKNETKKENKIESKDNSKIVEEVKYIEEKIPDYLKKFVPEDFYVSHFINDDVNFDNKKDWVLSIIERKENRDEDDENKTFKRLLLIITQDEDENYILSKKSDKLIYCLNCGGMMGDPYMGLLLNDDKSFTIQHYGGSSTRWERNLKFKYSIEKNDWFLVENEGVSFNATDNQDEEGRDILDKREINKLTPQNFGEIRIEEFDIYADK